MKVKRKISNKEFEEARTPQIKQLIINVSRTYAKTLNPDMLRATGDIALWRCLQSHDPKYGSRFTTSLHRFIHWECLRAIRDYKKKTMTLFDDVESQEDLPIINMILDDYLCVLNERDRRIIEARFLESCTFTEIAGREGLSKQGIKGIVDRSVLVMSEAARVA